MNSNFPCVNICSRWRFRLKELGVLPWIAWADQQFVLAETIFQVTLVEQKSHVKRLIREEISKLTEEEPDSPEQEEGAVEAGNDDKEEEEQDTSKITEEESKEDAEQPAEEAVGGD